MDLPDCFASRVHLTNRSADMLAALRELVEAFPPTLHRNGRQVAALAEARTLVADLGWIELA